MLMLANALGQSHLNVGEAGVVALLGYAVVFFGLILLMVVVILSGKAFVAMNAKKETANAVPAPVAAPETPKPVAPGSAGGVKLYNVEPKTAAMLMAIVAEKTGRSLNELRFISIKEVE